MEPSTNTYAGPILWVFVAFLVLGGASLVLHDRARYPHRGEPGRCIVCGEPATHSLVRPGQAAPLSGSLCLKHARDRQAEGGDLTPVALLFASAIAAIVLGGWSHAAFMRRGARRRGAPPS